jgi:hypothetical protein
MHKIKSVFSPDAYGTSAFAGLSSAMLLCFIGGAALISFSLGTIGFIVMSVGLLLSLVIWSMFFADYLQ